MRNLRRAPDHDLRQLRRYLNAKKKLASEFRTLLLKYGPSESASIINDFDRITFEELRRDQVRQRIQAASIAAPSVGEKRIIDGREFQCVDTNSLESRWLPITGRKGTPIAFDHESIDQYPII